MQWRLCAVALLLVATVASRRLGADDEHRRRYKTRRGDDRKPNIILILTDDQDVELGSLNFMPRTLRLLRDGGAEFRHAYVTTPMCCPSRSSLLTGMYVHNHGVYTNNDNCSSPLWQATHETRSFATYLSNAGYRTGYFGKYLNKYNGSYIPPGWREWGGLIMNSKYYNYSINLNGKKIKHGSDYHKDYYPDLIANDSVSFLRQSKQYFGRKPVMLVLSFPAPHGPEDSAPQYAHLFFNVTTHHTPTYDYAPNPDKQWILRVTPPMQPIHRSFTDLLMTKRLQTLQSVDDAVDKIVQELRSLNELDNTYIVYTSDHGYHLGQFGLVKGKSFPFEFDVRVPFLVRGPDIEPGTVIDDIVLNLDLAPTFLDIAGVEAPAHMDGRSFLHLLKRGSKPSPRKRKFKWPDTFLIESSGRREMPDSGTSGVDVTVNPLQHSEEDDELPTLARPDLQSDNRVVPIATSSVNKVERLAIDCQRPELQGPCQPGQKWHCVLEGARWRKHKCKYQTTNFLGIRGPGKKCICPTPTNKEYTNLEVNERRMQRQFLRGHVSKDIKDFRPKFLPVRRIERSIQTETDEFPLDRLEVAAMDPDILDKLLALYAQNQKFTARHKREVTDFVSSRMDDISEEIDNLKETQKLQNNVQPGCILSATGTVNCSNLVYKDPKAWRSSRNSVDEQIRKLKQELEALKEIRRHLRLKKPITSYDASHEEEDEDEEDEDDEADEVTDDVEEDEVNEDDDSRRDDENTDLGVEESEDSSQEIKVHLLTSTERNHHKQNELKPNHTLSEIEGIRHKNQHRKGKKKKISVESSTENTVQANKEDSDSGRTFDESLFEDYDDTHSKSTQHPPNHHRHNHLHHVSHVNITTESPIMFSSVTPGLFIYEHNRTLYNQSDLVTPGPNDSDTFGEVNKLQGSDTDFAPNFDTDTNDENSSFDLSNQGQCYCDADGNPYVPTRQEEKELLKEARRRLKEEKLKKKQRKLRRKAKLEKECGAEKMNCFTHDDNHWKTAPFWNGGPFCFCMNANNNTYSCLRTINATHNILYCEFVTGLRTFYNLRVDPFEQWNRIHSLTTEELSYLHDQLETLKACRGAKQCTVGNAAEKPPLPPIHITHHTPIYNPHSSHNFKRKKFPNPGEGVNHGRVSGSRHIGNARGDFTSITNSDKPKH